MSHKFKHRIVLKDGVWKLRFPALAFGLSFKLKILFPVIIAMAVLHNILTYLPTLERENNGDFTNDIFWLCMNSKQLYAFKLQTKRCIENRNLFYTDVLYPSIATKYEYKICTSAKADLK